MAEGSKKTEAAEMTKLVARMEADSSALADRIFAKVMASSSSSVAAASKASKPSGPSPKTLRPGNLGVGATYNPAATSTAATSLTDPRLKGRLTAKRKRDGDEEAGAPAALPGKRTGPERNEASEEETDQEMSRSASLGKRGKRKADHGNTGDESNVAEKGTKKGDLFAAAAAKVEKQRQAQTRPPTDAQLPASQLPLNGTVAIPEGLSKSQRKKLKKKLAAAGISEQPKDSEEEEQAPLVQSSTPQTIASTLTPMQSKLHSSLLGAQFRSINERLYTTSTQSALEYMRDDPEQMRIYHEGFHSQTLKWPVNPVDQIAARITEVKPKSQHHIVVDLGAGTAPLAMKMKGAKDVSVLSFDLLDSPDGWVVGCDVGTQIPLPGRRGGPVQLCYTHQQQSDTKKRQKLADWLASGPEVADVAVFSLSLMGQNWTDMLIEARRVLKTR